MRRIAPWIACSSMLLMAVLLVACASQKEPAQKAVAQIEASIASLKEDASKYASTELQGVEASLGELKDKLAQGDYKAVLADVPRLQAAVSALQTTVSEQKANAEAAMAAAREQWTSLSTDVPKMVAAIQSRVDILGKSRKLPKNVSQSAFDSARAGLDYMKSTWNDATTAFTSGDAVSAVDKANAVKQKGNEVLAQLGMTSS
jgi:hypothetical protein